MLPSDKNHASPTRQTFMNLKNNPVVGQRIFSAVRRCCLTGFPTTFVFELLPAKSWQAFRTLASSANNLWSSAVRRGPAPQFKCQKVCILANWLVKGQPVSDNETHGGCSLEVLRAAGAYKSCPGDGQRLSPPGMVYEGCSWQLFREQNNALKAVSPTRPHPPPFPVVGCKEIRKSGLDK